MLDSFEIFTTSGVVLWSKSYSSVGVNIVNSLIKDVFIEENLSAGGRGQTLNSTSQHPSYAKDRYTLKWTAAKDLGLIFVAVYQSIIHLSWIDQLLDNVKTLFIGFYRDQLAKPFSSSFEYPFDDYFDRQVQELEKNAVGAAPSLFNSESTAQEKTTEAPILPREADASLSTPQLNPVSQPLESDNTSTEVTPIPTPDGSRPSTPNSNILTAKAGPGGRGSRRARKAAATSNPILRDQFLPVNKKAAAKPPAGKQKRRWGEDGIQEDGDTEVLDYSQSTPVTSDSEQDKPNGVNSTPNAIEQSSWAHKTGRGEVVLKDLDDEMDSILSNSASKGAESAGGAPSAGLVNTGMGAISGLFRNVVGGKQLTQEDLVKPLKGMEDLLVKKNVAHEAALRLCEAVSRDLSGSKTASFQSIDNKIRSSMERALTKILTPTSSLDLLRSIATHVSLPSSGSGELKRPYVISVVGVNGVGKSTTLAKLAFLLLHNNYRVLVAGADTFRSGAVEQLRVHVRNLQSLISNASTASNPLGHIDLYERGYGKDPAHIARDAVAFASAPAGDAPYDVVLIDTAGRRHNDSRLMSSLEGFARLAVPDKIFMVGEALVGSDSVAQARHFNGAFGPGRRLDGFIVSKCDTVGEMVGTVVSMVHATGVPVVAVGVGQHYGDLRGLNVRWCTNLLMQ